MIRTIAIATVLTVLASAQVASAIVTAPLRGGQATRLRCRVLNTDNVAHPVTITIRRVNTDEILSTSSTPVNPASTRSIGLLTDAIAYCEVTGLSKALARVTFCVEDGAGACIAATTVP